MNERTAIAPIELDILVQAPPEVVYGILSTPDGFARWMGAARGHFDPVRGSPFRLEFPQYEMSIEGEVVEFEENRRVAVTWGAARGPQAELMPAGSTLLELSLEAEEEGTRVRLRHSGIGDAEQRESHAGGWRFHGSRLALLANRDHLARVLPRLLETYRAAWAEEDAGRRADLLRACCTEHVRFADEYASFEGRDLLSLHIANCHRFVPGTTIEAAGPPYACRGEILRPWTLRGADGATVSSGHDVLSVSADGRIERVTGFWSESRLPDA